MLLQYVYILYIYVDSVLTYAHPYTQLPLGANQTTQIQSYEWSFLRIMESGILLSQALFIDK